MRATKIILFTAFALTLGMIGIFFLPLPPWGKLLIGGIYGGVVGWVNTKLKWVQLSSRQRLLALPVPVPVARSGWGNGNGSDDFALSSFPAMRGA